MNFTYKKIWLISFPVMMSLLVEQLINITDAIFLGHVGEVELGAAAIAGIYYLAVYMLGFGFSLGLQVLIARKNGEKEYKETGRIFYQGLFFLIFMAVLFSVLIKIFSPYILFNLISSENVYKAVIDYIDWRCFGLLFAFPALAIRSFLVGIVKTGILTASAVVLVITNIILNYLLIFGSFGFPELGIKGAAIASSTAEMVSLFVLVIYMLVIINKTYYGLHFYFDYQLLKRILKTAVWSMLYSFISIAPWFLFFVAIERLGEDQLAIANIIRSISTFFFVIVSSIATTAGSLVSNLIGAGESKNIRAVCCKVIKLGYFIGFPLILLVIIFSDPVIGIYTDSQNLINEAFVPLVVMLSVYIFSVPGHIYSNIVIGTGNTRISFLFQVLVISVYLLQLYVIYKLPMASVALYWTCELVFVLLLFLFSYFYMKRWLRKNNS
ncbi:MAG: MATE family efflux transporter [Dysgonomonas sp.]|nr:MATE family efflux transporter [Dysgonomonas sp.]